ncbi:MAG TPA: dienelactone hydrolase family protein [Terriglobales bacterium]|nr:dienelactone hydrolase family protein [Terriglobales bacterium]
MDEMVSLEVADGSSMAAYVARPAGARARQGVLVLQEAFGVNAHIREVAQRLAGEGYLALAPELYHRTAPGFEGDYQDFGAAMPHMKAMTAEGQEQDAQAGYDWLRGQGAERVVAVGFCLGGRVAVRAAARVPLAAAASFYGGQLTSLQERVEAIRGPLLLVWGDEDTHIPLEQRAGFAAMLRQAGREFVECTFSAAGHGFFCDHRASYHARSARVAWGLLREFLQAEG